MAVPDERLVLEASVVDDFSSTLGDLADNLRAVDRLAEHTIENLTAEVNATQAKAELAELGTAMEAVDDDVDISTDIDSGLGDNQLFNLDGVDLTDEEAMGVADMFNPKAAFRQTPGLGPDGGDAGADATADGGGDDTGVLGPDDIDRFRDAFGEAFDPSAVFSDRQPQRGIDLLGDDMGEFIDQDATLEKILDDESDLDVDVFERLAGLDPDDTLDALDELQDAGVTNLPTSLTDRFRNLELKMGDFFRIFAALVPLLAVFVGAIPAAISGIVALGGAALAAAGALAGVGGLALLSGVLTSSGEVDTSQLTERIEELFDEAAAEMGPVVQQFAPLLDESFQTIEDTIADIADRADVFRRVVGDAEGALQFLEETVPSAMADIVRFGDAAMPIIAGVIREAGNMDILEAFADLIVRMGPNLAILTKLIIGILPAIIQLSQGFLYVATVITGVLYGLARVIDVVPYAGQVIGLLTGALLALVSVTALFVLATGEGAVASILAMTGSMLTSIPVIGSYIASLNSATIAVLGYEVSVTAAAAASAVLLGIITFGLGPALGFLSGGFTDLSSDIDKATSSLESFASASDSLDGTQVGVNGGMGATGVGGQAGGYQDASQITVVAGDKETGNAIANSLAFTSLGGQLGESNIADRLHDGGT